MSLQFASRQSVQAAQDAAARKLVWAVIELAILDACIRPSHGVGRLPEHVRSAFDFLEGDGLDRYCELLDVDGPEFRARLIGMMGRPFVVGDVFDDSQRRAFRANHRQWMRETMEVFER